MVQTSASLMGVQFGQSGTYLESHQPSGLGWFSEPVFQQPSSPLLPLRGGVYPSPYPCIGRPPCDYGRFGDSGGFLGRFFHKILILEWFSRLLEGLGRGMGVLGEFWNELGSSWGSLGRLLGRLGVLLGLSLGPLGASWGLLKRSWELLGCLLGSLGRQDAI